LGSDDQLHDNLVLEDVARMINPFVKVLYGSILLTGDTGWARKGQVYDGAFNIEKLLRINIPHQGIFYHRDVVCRCGSYNLKYRICADYDFNLRVASKFKMQYFDRIITIFNAGGTSTDVRDLAFGEDFATNIIKYFSGSIYKKVFKKYERKLLSEAKISFRSSQFLRGAYYYSVGQYFRIKRGFNKFLRLPN